MSGKVTRKMTLENERPPSLIHLDLREQPCPVVDAVLVGPVDDAVPHVGVVQHGRRRHDEVGAALAHRVVHAVHLIKMT